MTTLPHALSTLDQHLPWVLDTYRDLHRHPELSLREHRTAGRVVEELRAMEAAVGAVDHPSGGFEIIEGVGGTGVIAVLRGGDGPTVLLRADMDGLPVREETGLEWASVDTGITYDGDGPVPVMHACGHDTHVASLLGSLRLLLDARDGWSGTVVAVFQPAEEQHNGAEKMVADGLVGRIPTADVALGQHVMPGPADAVEIAAGPIMAACDDFRITLRGRGAHGASPHLGLDPVVMAASLVMRLQTVVSRHTDPEDAAVLSVGRIEGGTKNNIIPEHAVVEGTVRSFDPEVSRRCCELIVRMAHAEADAHGAPEPEVRFYDRLPVTDNDPGVVDTVRGALREALGEDRVAEMPRASGSEDFSVLPDAFGTPYAYWNFGAFDRESWLASEDPHGEFPDNHSPAFAPVPEVSLRTGVTAMTAAAWAWLGRR
ncbi:MAG: amidohydrolase [Nesterenkonia sp.]|nr:amidohydrolase [Nesterenkonia sp.]